MNGIQRLLAPMDGAPGSRSWSLKKDQANSPSVVEIKHSEHNKQTVGENHRKHYVYNTNMSDLLSSDFLDPVLAFNSSTEWDLDNLSSKGKYMRSIIYSDEERR